MQKPHSVNVVSAVPLSNRGKYIIALWCSGGVWILTGTIKRVLEEQRRPLIRLLCVIYFVFTQKEEVAVETPSSVYSRETAQEGPGTLCTEVK